MALLNGELLLGSRIIIIPHFLQNETFLNYHLIFTSMVYQLHHTPSTTLAFAAIEVDNYLRGKKGNFAAINDVRNWFADEVYGYDTSGKINNAFLLAIYNVIRSTKHLETVDHVVLEMRLIDMELFRLKELPPERLQNLRDFFISASRQFEVKPRLW